MTITLEEVASGREATIYSERIGDIWDKNELAEMLWSLDSRHFACVLQNNMGGGRRAVTFDVTRPLLGAELSDNDHWLPARYK